MTICTFVPLLIILFNVHNRNIRTFGGVTSPCCRVVIYRIHQTEMQLHSLRTTRSYKGVKAFTMDWNGLEWCFGMVWNA